VTDAASVPGSVEPWWHDGGGAPSIALADKVAFLRRPDAYPDPILRVDVRETHMSWVFLTEHEVFKLKKPVVFAFLDYSTLQRRKLMCQQEVLLNRRLADWVYTGLAALCRDDRGALSLCPQPPPGTQPVEWLVRMQRLPEALMLDNAIAAGTVDDDSARRTAAHLAAFFAAATPAALPPGALAARQAEEVRAILSAIAAAGVPQQRLGGLTHALHAFVERHGALLQSRADDRRIVDGHGDLRPEHVFLGQPPAVIDCIEFSERLRQVDPLDELAFLWMECELLGDGSCGELFLQVYLQATGDDAADELLWFYMSRRACLRAQLSLGHLGDCSDSRHWRRKADAYLDLADRYARRL
jgi:aminoglycoside phosphotransferase family enzyme